MSHTTFSLNIFFYKSHVAQHYHAYRYNLAASVDIVMIFFFFLL